MKRINCTIVRGLWTGVKWAVIQYSVLLIICLLLYCGVMLGIRVSGGDERAWFTHAQHGFYSFWSGFFNVNYILSASILFGLWHTVCRERRLWWTVILPWAVHIAFVYLDIAYRQEWNFGIIRVDGYMLGGWMCPVFGFLVLWTVRSIWRGEDTIQTPKKGGVLDRMMFWTFLFPAHLLVSLIAAAYVQSFRTPLAEKLLILLFCFITWGVFVVTIVQKTKGTNWQSSSFKLCILLLLPVIADLLMFIRGDINSFGGISFDDSEMLRILLTGILLCLSIVYYRASSRADIQCG